MPPVPFLIGHQGIDYVVDSIGCNWVLSFFGGPMRAGWEAAKLSVEGTLGCDSVVAED